MTRLALAALLSSLPVVALASPGAKAILKDAGGAEVGAAAFDAVPGGVKVTVSVHGLKPGPHGFHVHDAGACAGPDFKTAGGHFNPAGKKHGLENPEGHHGGDLPNLVVAADGAGQATAVLHGVTLGDGKDGLFHPGGTAVVIHADADDGKTDPSGNSGARIACGVVTKP
jgi:Cu-Zn family superoxide dismutase